MTVVCAWCRRLLGTKPPADDSSTTHGICPPCRDRVLATLEAMFVRERYLDSQPVGHWPSAVCKAEACWDRPHLHTALGLCPVRHGDVIAQGRVVGCYQP